jgi:hypothetical protein
LINFLAALILEQQNLEKVFTPIMGLSMWMNMATGTLTLFLEESQAVRKRYFSVDSVNLLRVHR